MNFNCDAEDETAYHFAQVSRRI